MAPVTLSPRNGDEAYQVMHNGIKIKLNSYYGNMMTRIISHFKGHHEPQEEKVFYEVLKSLPDEICMIEAGSYWAYYSMWARKEKRSVRNILIEPVDENAKIGKDNFALNDMTGEFVRAYVGETSLAPHAKRFEDKTIEDLERVSIDDLFERMNLGFAHIIHADVQGAELELLRGSLKTIKQSKIGYIMLSTHGDGIHVLCRNFLLDNEFHIVAEHTRSQSFSTDGLLVARAKGFSGIDNVTISKNPNRKNPLPIIRYIFSLK